MFRKIVSNLSFSPALVGQLGFYAKRLRKEQTTRRLGLIFVALALVVQCLAVFQPPESANASNPNDFVPGGLGVGAANRSINNFLAPYDANSRNLRDVITSIGITREEITAASYTSFLTGEKYGWSYNSRAYGTDFRARDAAGNQVALVSATPMKNIFGSSTKQIWGWVGYSAKVGWFAVMQVCGNIVTDIIPPEPQPPVPPPPGKVTQSKTATNISQGNVSASTVAAKEGDKITYTITVENEGGSPIAAALEDNLGDVLEYSELIDKGGGVYDETTRLLTWPEVTLAAKEKQTRTFSVQVLSTIPATPVGQSDPKSFDCLMDNKFGNSITIPVVCAPPKVIETVTTELPKTGPTENMIFAGIVLSVVTYFFMRSKQLNKEVRLIRRDLNAGTI